MNKSKSTPEQNEGQREFFRIVRKYDRKLKPFMGKSLTPGSSEHKKYEKIMQKRSLDLQNWEKKYCKPEQPIDTPERLLMWIEHVLDGFGVAKAMARGFGVVSTKEEDISDIQKKYDEARDYVFKLYKKNRALPKPPSIESDPKVGLEKIRDWCWRILTNSGKKIAEQDAKRTIAAILISLLIICAFVLSVCLIPFTPFTWLRNHPNSYGIQGSIICLIPCLVFAIFKSEWRKWCLGVAGLAFLGVLLSLLGGRQR